MKKTLSVVTRYGKYSCRGVGYLPDDRASGNMGRPSSLSTPIGSGSSSKIHVHKKKKLLSGSAPCDIWRNWCGYWHHLDYFAEWTYGSWLSSRSAWVLTLWSFPLPTKTLLFESSMSTDNAASRRNSAPQPTDRLGDGYLGTLELGFGSQFHERVEVLGFDGSLLESLQSPKSAPDVV